ncbi:MAG: HAD family hydrolase [Acidimicrobiia bacterium]|nr:HAD family hydrolase [Acidimicrobiia bacterium]MDH5237144.1 HAD family hydrolase [Acidimicrobiia bacterium]
MTGCAATAETAPGAPELRAITFDFWNTLVRLDETVGHQRRDGLAAVLAEHGRDLGLEAVEAALGYTRDRFDHHWRRNRQYVLDDAVADLLAVLGVEADDALSAALRECWLAGGAAASVSLTEPALPSVLAELRGRGLCLGIVCDTGLMPGIVLRGHLDRLGLSPFFTHLSFSDEVGVYKPAAGIFEDAFVGLGVTGAEALHVGDLHRTDVLGGRTVGARVVRYRGAVDDPDAPAADPAPVIDSLTDL